jgi:hypothetical protein
VLIHGGCSCHFAGSLRYINCVHDF